MMCEHVYKDMGTDICPKCGKDTHRTDWAYLKQQRREHREKVGLLYTVREWWSI